MLHLKKRKNNKKGACCFYKLSKTQELRQAKRRLSINANSASVQSDQSLYCSHTPCIGPEESTALARLHIMSLFESPLFSFSVSVPY